METKANPDKTSNAAQQTYHCSQCGGEIHKHDVFCPKCGKKLDYYDFE